MLIKQSGKYLVAPLASSSLKVSYRLRDFLCWEHFKHLVWIIEQFEVSSRILFLFFCERKSRELEEEAQEEEFLPGFNLHLNGFDIQA